MRDQLKEKLKEAKSSAVRLRKASEAAARAKLERDVALYHFFDDIHAIVAAIPTLPMRDRWEVLGKKYQPFRNRSQFPALVLQKVAPELNAKKRAKYAAVLRYVLAQKAPGETVRDFVRKNGGINRCVTKQKRLRNRAAHRSKT